jgi:hypothetical protein
LIAAWIVICVSCALPLLPLSATVPADLHPHTPNASGTAAFVMHGRMLRAPRRGGTRDRDTVSSSSPNALPQQSNAPPNIDIRPVLPNGSMNHMRGPTRYSHWAVEGKVLQGAYPGMCLSCARQPHHTHQRYDSNCSAIILDLVQYIYMILWTLYFSSVW